jgi:hypothetical protein
LLPLEDVPARDLIAAARVLERMDRDSGLRSFAQPLRSFVFERREGGDPWLARIELAAAIILARDGLLARLEDAPEPFWTHVRDGLRARRDSFVEEAAQHWVNP